MTAILQPQPQVPVSTVTTRNGEAEIFEQLTCQMKSGVVPTTDGGPPLSLRGACHQFPRQAQEVAPIHVVSTLPNRNTQACAAGQCLKRSSHHCHCFSTRS